MNMDYDIKCSFEAARSYRLDVYCSALLEPTGL